MDEIKEGILIKRAQSGKLEAFEELIKEHEQVVYNIVFKIVKNYDDTYDIAQETFIKVYTKINQFNHKSKFSTWIYRIATNTALDKIRKTNSQKEVPLDSSVKIEDSAQDIEKDFLKKEEHYIMGKALDLLSEDHRVILTLRDIQGFSYEEISAILDISLGTVKSRISRGRIELKKILMQDVEPFKTYFRHITRGEEKA